MGGPGSGDSNQYWTDTMRETVVKEISSSIGRFPSRSDLESMGRGDVVNQISKNGGFVYWSDRIGIPREHSDSDTGWDGELAFQSDCDKQAIVAIRMKGIKSPYDLLIGGTLRVDVKAAKYTEYIGKSGSSHGWYYRIGKHVQADLVVLYQLDTGSFYGIPWWVVPTTNISIAKDGGKYARYLNNWPLIRQMISLRSSERSNL